MAKTGESSTQFNASMRLIVLHGEERFLIEEYTRQIAGLLDEKFGGIEQFNFDGGIVEPAVLLDELRSYGLMQRHKLVVLDNADQFLAGGRNAGDEDEQEEEGGSKTSRRPLMERYAESPVDDATLLMRAGTWRKGNLDKLIVKHGVIMECETPATDRAARWCVGRCNKRYNATLAPDAAELMVRRLGPSLQRLDTELLKLASMAGEGKTITRELVEQNIAPSREEKAWEIQAAVASGSAVAMLGKLHDLTSVSRQEYVPIAWAVMDLMRKEHAASHLVRKGVPPQGVAKALRLWGASTDQIIGAAKRAEPQRFAQLLRDSINTDLHSKSGLGEPLRNLEALMVKIADVTGDRH